MDVGALAIDTLAPTIVLQDGTMHRLAADQRDAVLAHELGHLARHDARRGFAVTVAAGLVAVQASRWLTIGPAVALLVGMLLLLRNVCRQRSELAADHLGARLAGSFPMARALDTTCAANAQQSFGPWSHALLSHPHLQVRAARVRAAAIDDTASAIAVDTVLVRRCERARRIAVAASAASLVAAIWTGAEGHESWSIALALAPAAAMLGTLLALQRWRHLLYVRQLGWRPLRTAKWRLVWLGLAALCVWLVTAIAAATAVFAVAAFVALVLAIGWGWRERRASARLDERMRAHDLHGWLAAYHALPRRLRQRPDLWLSAVRLRWRRDGAAAAARELSALRSRWPHYHLATIDHISQLRATDPAAAMAVARTLHERFPDNPWTVGSLAATLRAAGSLDEAWHLAQRLARLPSVPGWADAIACRIAVARGDLAAARVAAARAGRAAPGDLVVLLAQAEFEVAAREPAAAATVARLQAIEGQTLVSYLRHDVAAVVQGLRDRGDPSAAATS